MASDAAAHRRPAAIGLPGQNCTLPEFPFPRLPVGGLATNLIYSVATLSDPQSWKGCILLQNPRPGWSGPSRETSPSIAAIRPDDVLDVSGLTRNDPWIRRLLEPCHVLAFLCQPVHAAVVLQVTPAAGELRRMAYPAGAPTSLGTTVPDSPTPWSAPPGNAPGSGQPSRPA